MSSGNFRTDLTTFNNRWYKAGPFFKRTIWYFINAWIIDSWLPSSSIRIKLLSLFGAKIGHGVIIKPRVNIKYPWNLKVGENCWIGEGAWIDNLAEVEIGNNCCISQGALLLCGNHDYKKSTFDLIIGNIVLEDGVWIGAKSTVCPGTICRSHAVLSAGSVASKELNEYSVYQGNPAVFIRKREMTA
jgi:putative colanic acid biosynthesis acetyltransferase WcaF